MKFYFSINSSFQNKRKYKWREIGPMFNLPLLMPTLHKLQCLCRVPAFSLSLLSWQSLPWWQQLMIHVTGPAHPCGRSHPDYWIQVGSVSAVVGISVDELQDAKFLFSPFSPLCFLNISPLSAF